MIRVHPGRIGVVAARVQPRPAAIVAERRELAGLVGLPSPTPRVARFWLLVGHRRILSFATPTASTYPISQLAASASTHGDAVPDKLAGIVTYRYSARHGREGLDSAGGRRGRDGRGDGRRPVGV